MCVWQIIHCLHTIISVPGIYSGDRGSLPSGCISDIYDGELYQALSSRGGPLIAGKYMSFTLNTDGVDCFDSTRVILACVVNELPFNVRWVQYSCIFPLPLPLFLNLLITVWVCITFTTGGYPKTWSWLGCGLIQRSHQCTCIWNQLLDLETTGLLSTDFLYHLTHVQPCMSILLILCLYRCCGWCTWCCKSLCDDGATCSKHPPVQWCLWMWSLWTTREEFAHRKQW